MAIYFCGRIEILVTNGDVPSAGEPHRVEVTWLDITSYSGWQSESEALEQPTTLIKSLGYLIGPADANPLRIAFGRQVDECGHCQLQIKEVLVLPRGCVVSVKTIEEVSDAG